MIVFILCWSYLSIQKEIKTLFIIQILHPQFFIIFIMAGPHYHINKYACRLIINIQATICKYLHISTAVIYFTVITSNTI